MKVGLLREFLVMMGQVFHVPGCISAHSIQINNDSGFMTLDVCFFNAATNESTWRKLTFPNDDDEITFELLESCRDLFRGA